MGLSSILKHFKIPAATSAIETSITPAEASMQEISATHAMTSLAEHKFPMYTGKDDLHLSPPMTTAFPSELEKQNKMLRGKIVQLESDVKCILDHSIESDQRLLHFTKDIFTAKYAIEPALSHNCHSDNQLRLHIHLSVNNV